MNIQLLPLRKEETVAFKKEMQEVFQRPLRLRESPHGDNPLDKGFPEASALNSNLS